MKTKLITSNRFGFEEAINDFFKEEGIISEDLIKVELQIVGGAYNALIVYQVFDDGK